MKTTDILRFVAAFISLMSICIGISMEYSTGFAFIWFGALSGLSNIITTIIEKA